MLVRPACPTMPDVLSPPTASPCRPSPSPSPAPTRYSTSSAAGPSQTRSSLLRRRATSVNLMWPGSAARCCRCWRSAMRSESSTATSSQVSSRDGVHRILGLSAFQRPTSAVGEAKEAFPAFRCEAGGEGTTNGHDQQGRRMVQGKAELDWSGEGLQGEGGSGQRGEH